MLLWNLLQASCTLLSWRADDHVLILVARRRAAKPCRRNWRTVQFLICNWYALKPLGKHHCSIPGRHILETIQFVADEVIEFRSEISFWEVAPEDLRPRFEELQQEVQTGKNVEISVLWSLTPLELNRWPDLYIHHHHLLLFRPLLPHNHNNHNDHSDSDSNGSNNNNNNNHHHHDHTIIMQSSWQTCLA